MELVAGRSLAERLKGGALPEAEVFVLTSQIVEALEAAHQRGEPGAVHSTPVPTLLGPNQAEVFSGDTGS